LQKRLQIPPKESSLSQVFYVKNRLPRSFKCIFQFIE
jgi:hypothetical protein